MARRRYRGGEGGGRRRGEADQGRRPCAGMARRRYPGGEGGGGTRREADQDRRHGAGVAGRGDPGGGGAADMMRGQAEPGASERARALTESGTTGQQTRHLVTSVSYRQVQMCTCENI